MSLPHLDEETVEEQRRIHNEMGPLFAKAIYGVTADVTTACVLLETIIGGVFLLYNVPPSAVSEVIDSMKESVVERLQEQESKN